MYNIETQCKTHFCTHMSSHATTTVTFRMLTIMTNTHTCHSVRTRVTVCSQKPALRMKHHPIPSRMQIPRDIRSTHEEHHITAHNHHTNTPLTQLTHPSNPSYQHSPSPKSFRLTCPVPLLKQPSHLAPPQSLRHTRPPRLFQKRLRRIITHHLSREHGLELGRGLGVRKSVLRVRLCLI